MKLPIALTGITFTFYFLIAATVSMIAWVCYRADTQYGEHSGRADLTKLLAWSIPLTILFAISAVYGGKQFMIARSMIVASEVLLILFVATLLFALKVVNLRLYAILEFVVALAVASQAAASLGPEINSIQTLTLLTSAYLMIRGMDNFKKDLSERRDGTQTRYSQTT